jgi:dephospho-CoA kinase
MARQLTEPGQHALADIADYFGKDILAPDGELNRVKLAGIIFTDTEKRRALEGIVLPRMREYIDGQKPELTRKGKNFLVVEGATIIEANHLDFCDNLIVVHTDRNSQFLRLIERNGYSRKEAMSRINSQMPLEEKVKYADFVIDNTGRLEETLRQVRELYGKLREIVESR